MFNIDHISSDSYCINTIYQCLEKINEGSFGYIYRGVNLVTKTEIAVKIEKQSDKAKSSLAREAKILRSLQNIPGIPEIYWCGKDKNLQCKALVMELLGKSLQERFKKNGKFSIRTILLLGEQLVEILKNVHSRGVIHRDIKPENIILGRGKNYKNIYLIDYGISKRFIKPTGDHIILTNYKPFIGTIRYASESAHQGLEQSRKDDLESLGYTLIYIAKGTLPWMHRGFKVEEKKAKVGEIKGKISLDELCQDMPSIFSLYFKYLRSLGFYDEPNYDYLRSLFATLQKSINLNFRANAKLKEFKRCSKSNDNSVSSDWGTRTCSGINIHINNINSIYSVPKPEEYDPEITERPGVLLKMKKLHEFFDKKREDKNKKLPARSKSIGLKGFNTFANMTSFLDGSKTVFTNSKSQFSELSENIFFTSSTEEKKEILGFMNENGIFFFFTTPKKIKKYFLIGDVDDLDEYINQKSMGQLIKTIAPVAKK